MLIKLKLLHCNNLLIKLVKNGDIIFLSLKKEGNMKSLKKLKVSLMASFDNFVNEVENQEAIINSIIDEVKEAFSNIRVQINDVERGLNRARNNEILIVNEIDLWKNRALDLKNEDEELAKDCLRKVITLEDELIQNQEIIKYSKECLSHFNKEKIQVETKLSEIKLKKSKFIAKESNIKANIEDVFNRWEDKLVFNEALTLNDKFESRELENRVNNLFEKLS